LACSILDAPVVRVENLTYRYAGHRDAVLSGVSLEVKKGEFVCIAGPSGCGKSTLALAIAGFIPHAFPGDMQGRILIHGRDTMELSPGALSGTVGLVQQDPEGQLCTLGVIDEVAFGPENMSLPPDEIGRRVKWALEAVGASQLAHRSVYTLSGGEKQRVAIASVLAMEPSVFILDEPTAFLDPQGTAEVLSVIHDLRNSRDMAVIVIEHRLQKILPFADRLVFMDAGKIIDDGPPAEVLNRNRSISSPSRRSAKLPFETRQSAPHRLPERRQSAQKEQAPTSGQVPSASEPLLVVSGLTVAYNDKPVLNDVDLDLYPGEIVAVMGDNGSGKTSLLSAIMGLVEPSAGKILLGGQDITEARVASRVRSFGYSFQNPNHQLSESTVKDEVAATARNLGHDSEPADITPLLEHFGLDGYANANPFSLSLGEKKRVTLASAQASLPRVLLLDEPLVGQDLFRQTDVMESLSRFAEMGGLAVMVCHEPRVVRDWCDRVLFFDDGKLILNEPVPDAFDDLARLGKSHYIPDDYESEFSSCDAPEDTVLEEVRAPVLNAAASETETLVQVAPPKEAPIMGGPLNIGYLPGATLVHRLNPLVKAVVLLAFTIACLLMGTPRGGLLLFLLLLSCYRLSAYGLGFFVRKLRVILTFCGIILAVQLLFWHHGPVLYSFVLFGRRFAFFHEGLTRGIAISLRFLNIVGSSYLFVSTTDPNQLAFSLMQAGLPYRYGFMLITALRFAPLFQLELQQVRNAQMVKGVDLQGKSLKDLMRQVRLTLLPLLVSALEKVDSLAMSMEGRAFGLYPTRTYLVSHALTRKDLIVMAVCLLVLAGLIAASMMGYLS